MRGRSPPSTTTPSASAPRSTWRGTGSAGQYRYFDRPLPEPVAELRAAFYPRLLPIARDWAARLGQPAPWPDALDEWLDMCHAAGQTRPTPILLRYGAGDWNALHRDLYGDLVFPLQVVIGLDEPGVDHTGGEFLLVEQRPRAQSRGHGDAASAGPRAVFTTRDRPVRSSPRLVGGTGAARRQPCPVGHRGTPSASSSTTPSDRGCGALITPAPRATRWRPEPSTCPTGSRRPSSASWSSACRGWARARPDAGRRKLPSGSVMSVQTVCLGWHWLPYRYTRTADDVDGAPVAPFPAWLVDLGREAVAMPTGRRAPRTTPTPR